MFEDDYDDVGAAPPIALHQHFGDGFTSELEQVWGTVCGEFAETMIAQGATSGR